MPERTEIRVTFGKEREAEAACVVAEDLIRFCYVFQEVRFDNVKEYLRGDPYKLYMAEWPDMKSRRDARVKNRRADSALQFLKKENCSLLFAPCTELQRAVPDLTLQSREGFFNCLCFILAWKFPRVPFEAVCRHEAEGPEQIQETRAVYDTMAVHFEQRPGASSPDGTGRETPVTSDWIIAPKCLDYQEEVRPLNPGDDDEDEEEDDEDSEDEEE